LDRLGSGARDSILPGARYTSYQGYRKVPWCIDFKGNSSKNSSKGRKRVVFIFLTKALKGEYGAWLA
jgi:hypothetical protein